MIPDRSVASPAIEGLDLVQYCDDIFCLLLNCPALKKNIYLVRIRGIMPFYGRTIIRLVNYNNLPRYMEWIQDQEADRSKIKN